MAFAGMRFLYVEDDPLSREVMRMIMSNGMGVTDLNVFEDSVNFMHRVKALDQQDVVLLDVHVKPYSGLDMLKMLRSDTNYEKAKIIALTASVMNEEIEVLRNSGFDGAIGKPLSVMTFPGLMERILAGEQVWHVS